MQVFRIFPARYSSTAFTGIGGLYAARRWNHLGTAMVYCASSRALAALEFFVNLEPNDAPDDLLMASATVPDDLVERLDLVLLPADWRELDNLKCRDLGSVWVKSARSAALLVPSVVVEGDWNVLLNPAHADFGKVAVAEAIPFRFDPRMFR
ncbi:MAG: RES family NAD+ phosphorylase [Terracidiphilus sp.]|jgi:RES domain-containing protein